MGNQPVSDYATDSLRSRKWSVRICVPVRRERIQRIERCSFLAKAY